MKSHSMRFRPLIALAFAACAALPAWAGDHGHDHDHDHDHAEETHQETHQDTGDTHLATVGDLRVLHAWTAATHDRHTLVFMEIENSGDQPVMITGGESPLAGQITLVGFHLQDGHAHYEPLDQVPAPAKAELELAPNGLALRLDGLTRELHKGDEFPLELNTSLGHIPLHVQVEAEGATAHSHAGHNH